MSMSKERELLKGWLCIAPLWIDPAYMKMYEDTKKLLAEPEQEPIAWILKETGTGYKTQVTWKPSGLKKGWEAIPLYTAPPRREPLGKEIKVPCGTTEYMFGFKDGVLYAEKHHGIGGEND